MEIVINVNIGVTPALGELLTNLAVAASNRASVTVKPSFAFPLSAVAGEAKSEKPARTTKTKAETPKTDTKPEPEPGPTTTDPDPAEDKPTYTAEQVRAKAVAVTQGNPENANLFKALLTEIGVKKLTDIKPEHYPMVMQRLEEMEAQ